MLLLGSPHPDSPRPGSGATSQERLRQGLSITHSRFQSKSFTPFPCQAPAAASPHQHTQARALGRETPEPGAQRRDARSLEARARCPRTQGMLTPLPTPLRFEWLPWASATGSRISAKYSKHCWEELWPNQSVPVPEGPRSSLWREIMLPTFYFCNFDFFPLHAFYFAVEESQ